MTAEKTSGSGAGALLGGGTALALVLVAMGWWVARDTGAPKDGGPATPAPVSQAADQADTQEDTAPTAAPTPQSPQFDVVRVEPDGSAVIAGQAQPGAQVQLLLDGQNAGQAEVDDNGNFVALLTLPPSDTPRVMELMVDGEKIETANQSVIVGPIAAPVAVQTPSPVAVADVPQPASTETSGEVADLAPDQVETPSAEDATTLSMDTTETTTASDDNAAAVAPEPEAAPAPQVLLADDQGIKVLQDGGGATPRAEVQLDSIAYDALGAVILAGRGAAKGAVQIYLDGAELARTVAGEDGQWRLELPPVAAGVYDLGVELRDENGTVISRVDTPFKREDPAKFAALASGEDETAEQAPAKTVANTAPTEQPSTNLGEVSTPVQGAAASAPSDAQVATARAADEPEEQAQTAGVPEQVAAAEAPRPATDTAGENAVAATETAATSDALPPRPKLITVQPGATLWAIARETLGEGTLYVQVFDANRAKIRNPDLIYPGQVFTVPGTN